jgi:hypothetical protein
LLLPDGRHPNEKEMLAESAINADEDPTLMATIVKTMDTALNIWT